MQMQKVCPRCQTVYPTSANFCTKDKQFLDQSTIRRVEEATVEPELAKPLVNESLSRVEPNKTVRAASGFVRLEILSLGKFIKVDVNSAIGRAIQPELANENTVSRQHCIFFNGTDGVRVRDNDSTNGTLVNNRRLQSQESRALVVGDTIQLGSITCRVVEITMQ